MTSAAAARAVGARTYFTGKPCKNGHVAERWTNRSVCVQCHRDAQAAAHEKSAVKRRARISQWCKDNPDRVQANKAKYRDLHRDALRERNRQYHANKPEVGAKNAAARRARRRQAQPPWMDSEQFREIYDRAADLSRQTGIKHSVDHIVPLRHPLVCGLHVPWNLQVLTLAENKSKTNTFEIQC